MSGSTKAFLAILIVILIVVPVFLGYALVKGLPYTLPNPAQSSTTSSSNGNVVLLPQGAGGVEKLNFNPSALTVSSGTTVEFQDQDSDAPHNVYFTSIPSGAADPNGGNPPILNKGSTYNVTLTTPGTYMYVCQFHSTWMQGSITVTG